MRPQTTLLVAEGSGSEGWLELFSVSYAVEDLGGHGALCERMVGWVVKAFFTG